MQNLKELNNSELVSRTKTLVLKERETTNEILWCLRMIQQRMIYAEYSCSSLFEFCVKYLGYSGGAASRRIRAMEFLKEVPETEKALKEGKVSLTTAASLQSYLQHEKKKRRENKEEETDKTASSPENLAVQNSSPPLENKTPPTLSSANKSSPDPHFVTAKNRRGTLQHAEWQCEHIDEKTGLRCTSRWALEIDHRKPVALGGSSSPENLRCLCRTHNAFAAVKIFGREKMGNFLPQTK